MRPNSTLFLPIQYLRRPPQNTRDYQNTAILDLGPFLIIVAHFLPYYQVPIFLLHLVHNAAVTQPATHRSLGGDPGATQPNPTLSSSAMVVTTSTRIIHTLRQLVSYLVIYFGPILTVFSILDQFSWYSSILERQFPNFLNSSCNSLSLQAQQGSSYAMKDRSQHCLLSLARGSILVAVGGKGATFIRLERVQRIRLHISPPPSLSVALLCGGCVAVRPSREKNEKS